MSARVGCLEPPSSLALWESLPATTVGEWQSLDRQPSLLHCFPHSTASSSRPYVGAHFVCSWNPVELDTLAPSSWPVSLMEGPLCPTVGFPHLQPEASPAMAPPGLGLATVFSSDAGPGGRESRVETWLLFSSCVTQGKILDLPHPHFPYL